MSLEHWIRLANVQLPARRLRLLLEEFGSPEAILDADIDALADVSGIHVATLAKLRDPRHAPTEADLHRFRALGASLLTIQDADYPEALRELDDAPPILFMRGELDERDRFAVAVVGSRHASPYGRAVTKTIVGDVAAAGLTVVSGGAIGIDAAAHRAALDAGGRTLAVLGCGLDRDYPQDNIPMFERIVSEGKGALLTEFPLGSGPEPWHFPQRNRIISALGMGLLVVEAGLQSGALITAQQAADQGKTVMAIPGNVDRPFSRGTNDLIRDGALLIQSADDVLLALNIRTQEPGQRATVPLTEMDPSRRRVLEALSLSPQHVDGLAAELALPSSELAVELTMLELSGHVRRLPGNTYVRVL